MGRAIIWALTCALTGCGLSTPKTIDAGSDLDCGVVFIHAEKNEVLYNTSEVQKRALYVFRSWYFTKIKKDQAADAQVVATLIRNNPEKVIPALKECTARAMKDPAFERWASFASNEFLSRSR